MGKFFNLFVFDLKRSFSRVNLFIIGLFLVICLYLVQSGIDRYRMAEQNINNYCHLESLKQNLNHLNGKSKENNLRFFIMPSVMSVFFNTPTILKSSLSNIPYSETPDIYTSLINGSEFNNLNIRLLSFSGFILYCGCFIVMMFGFKAFCYKGFLKFLTGFTGSISMVYFATLLSRVFSIILIYTFISAGSFLFASLNGIAFSWPHDIRVYIFFSAAALVLLILFLLLGMLFGTINQKSVRHWGPAFAWIILVLVIPAEVEKSFADRSNALPPTYQLGAGKLKLLLQKEKKSREQWYREFDSWHRDKLTNKLKKEKTNTYVIMNLQKKIFLDYAAHINNYLQLSALFPTTFYLSLEREVGGGFIRILDLYRHILNIEDIRSIVNFSNLPDWEKPHYKPAQVYMAKSFLPGNFSRGWWVSCFFILIFQYICYYRFRIWIFGSLPRKLYDTTQIELTIKPGERRLIRAPVEFVQLFFNRLSGGTRIFKGKLNLDQLNMSAFDKYQIIYLADPYSFPGGIKVFSLFNFI